MDSIDSSSIYPLSLPKIGLCALGDTCNGILVKFEDNRKVNLDVRIHYEFSIQIPKMFIKIVEHGGMHHTTCI